MNAYDKLVLKTSLVVAAAISVLYAVIVIIIAQFHFYAYYALCGVPVIFALTCSFSYTLKQGMLKFLTPKTICKVYDNPADRYFLSQWRKEYGSYILTAMCFFPTLAFYILFSWIFLIKNHNAHIN